MHCESYNCYKFDHIFLPLIRLWIDNTSWLQNLQDLMYLLIFLSALVIQITPLFTTSLGLDNFLNDVSYITLTCISLLKYGEFRYSAGKIRTLLENMQHDWNRIQNDEEYKIMRKYVENGQYIGLVLATCFIPGLIFIILSPLYPTVGNIIAGTNKTRTFRLPVDVDYFVDQRKYFTFIMFHVDLVCTLEILILFLTEVVLLVFIEHSCALFKLTGYQIAQAIDACTLPNVTEKCHISCGRLIKAVETHKRAIQFVEYITQNFTTSYAVLWCISVPNLSFNLYRLSHAVVLMNDIEGIWFIVVTLIGMFGYMFLLNYVCQDIIDHGNELFEKTYDCQWYAAPLPAQKLLLFITQRSMKSSSITILEGMYISSLQGFSMTLRVSFSYFMFIYSTQAPTF